MRSPLIIMSYDWSLEKDTSIDLAKSVNLDRDVYIACYGEPIYQKLAKINGFKLLHADPRFPKSYMGKRNAILQFCRQQGIESFYLLEDCLRWVKQCPNDKIQLYQDTTLKEFLRRADAEAERVDPDVMSFWTNPMRMADPQPSGFYTVFTRVNMRLINEYGLWYYDNEKVYDDDMMYYIIHWLGGTLYKPRNLTYKMSQRFHGIKNPADRHVDRKVTSNKAMREIIKKDVIVMADWREAYGKFSGEALEEVQRNIVEYYENHPYNQA